MLEFTKLEKDVNKIKEYIARTGGIFCDLSLGVRFMWGDDFSVEYAVVNDTLILKESGPEFKDVFYFPIGSDKESALLAIEEYTKSNNIPLIFCYIDDAHAEILTKRYDSVKVSFNRDWCDYIYTAEQFKTYAGKKLSGQRNHVNKFKRLYPDYKFKVIEPSDLPRVKAFLDEFNAGRTAQGWTEKVDEKTVYDLVDNMFSLSQYGGYLEVDGKMVAVSVGEKVGSMLMVHIEKALVGYDGVYPTMAQEFARAFATDGIEFINREEDCGDLGLRTSKTQYRPIEIKNKNIIKVNTLFSEIQPPVTLRTARLTIGDITQSDKENYLRLYLDDDLNKWWGYDYREDLKESTPTADYFYNFQNSLKDKREEYSLAVRLDGVMIGELVLHNFDCFGGVEIGFRFFREYHGKGYATESAARVIEYAVNTLGAKTIKSRCYKQNAPSRKLIERLGLKLYAENETHYFFKKEF